MRALLRMLGDSSLPRPHHTPRAHIGTALFHARHTATTGTDIIPLLVVLGVLIVLGLAFLVAYRRLAR